MSRIRSVHPGLFTDEKFILLSERAQVFFIGLWTEADDYGAFEWKPITLKIKLRGGKDGDVEPLLEEMISVDCITRYEHGGRQLGLIRNFCRYQRLNSRGMQSISYQMIYGATPDQEGLLRKRSDMMRDQFQVNEEKYALVEDVGGRSAKERKKDALTRHRTIWKNNCSAGEKKSSATIQVA